MTCEAARMGDVGVIVCSSPDYYITDGRGRVWHFDFHRFCGPTPLRMNSDEPFKRMPAEESPFWVAVVGWHKQGEHGRRDEKTGRVWAIWDKEEK